MFNYLINLIPKSIKPNSNVAMKKDRLEEMVKTIQTLGYNVWTAATSIENFEKAKLFLDDTEVSREQATELVNEYFKIVDNERNTFDSETIRYFAHLGRMMHSYQREITQSMTLVSIKLDMYTRN